MQSYTSTVAEDRQDVLSWVVNPGIRPPPTRGRLMEVLSKLMDGPIGKCCHSLVGLAEAAVALFRPPSVGLQGEDSIQSIPGTFDDSGAPNSDTGNGLSVPYSCECTICARRDELDLVNERTTNAMEEGQGVYGTNGSAGPSSTSSAIAVKSPLMSSAGPSTSSSAKEPASKELKLGGFLSRTFTFRPSIPKVDPVFVATGRSVAKVAPFFQRGARPASGEFNRQAVARYTEQMIRHPGLKPFLLKATIDWSTRRPETESEGVLAETICAPLSVTPTPGSDATFQVPSSGHEDEVVSPSPTPTCLPLAEAPVWPSLETIGWATLPFFHRRAPNGDLRQPVEETLPRIGFLKRVMKALGLTNSSANMSHPSLPTSTPRSQAPPSLICYIPPVEVAVYPEGPTAVSCPPIPIRTASNGDMCAAPCFTRQGRLERRKRVVPRRLPIPKVERGVLKDSCPSSPGSDSSAPSTPAPATPVDGASPLGFRDSLVGNMVDKSRSDCFDDSEGQMDDIISLYSSPDGDRPDSAFYSPAHGGGDVYATL